MIEIDVLSVLTKRENWDKFGAQFTPDFWEGATHRTLFEFIRDYWGSAPKSVVDIGIDIFERFVKERITGIEEQAAIIRTANKIADISTDKVVPIVRNALLYWKARNIILEASDDLDRWEFDASSIAAQFDSLARAVEAEEDPEPDPSRESLAILMQEQDTLKYPTGLSDLDLSLKGGLWAKEIGVLIAPVYAGKTYSLVHLGAAALKAGFPVQHWTTEISRNRVIMRYYQNLLGVNRDYLALNLKEVHEKITGMNLPPWSVKDYSATGVGTPVVRRKAREFAKDCDFPPLIIVDHVDLDGVKPANSRLEGRFALTAVTEELRQITAELGCGLWTAVQANREAFGNAHIRMQNAAESLGPVRKADVIITLNQNDEEKAEKLMRWHIEKARERVISVPTITVKALTEFQRFEDE